jgi:hypothetical protein
MTLPNFLLIGAAKSGTTSLYHYLGQHPQIYTNVKEPSYFAFAGQQVSFAGPGDRNGFVRRMVTDPERYEALFDGVTNEQAYGEASVVYLYHPAAAWRIKQTVPDVKLIAMLRNPVERAFSGYLHLRRDGREPLANFTDALRAEEGRIAANWEHQWHYARLGFYYAQLRRYYDLFSPGQIAVYLYDEFQAQPEWVLKDIFRFLGVDDSVKLNTTLKHNVSGQPRWKGMHSFMIGPHRAKDVVRPFLPRFMRRYLGQQVMQLNVTAVKPTIPPEARDYLCRLYHREVAELQRLLNRDLSHWLNGQMIRQGGKEMMNLDTTQS